MSAPTPRSKREGELEGRAFCLRPVHPKPDDRRQLFRKQVFASLVAAMGVVIRHRPRFILGIGQGGLISALLAMPLVVEAACRARIVLSDEMRALRQCWAGVVGCLAVDPVALPARSDVVELRAAVPELLMTQPRGVLRSVWFSGKDVYHRHEFARELAADIGTVARDAPQFFKVTRQILVPV